MIGAVGKPYLLMKAGHHVEKFAQLLPDHLSRERLVHPAPTACSCCGSTALRKIGEDVTETLEHVPSSWKVIQHVREKFSCRSCETIAQTPNGRRAGRLRSKPATLTFALTAAAAAICALRESRRRGGYHLASATQS
jgi:transposase